MSQDVVLGQKTRYKIGPLVLFPTFLPNIHIFNLKLYSLLNFTGYIMIQMSILPHFSSQTTDTQEQNEGHPEVKLDLRIKVWQTDMAHSRDMATTVAVFPAKNLPWQHRSVLLKIHQLLCTASCPYFWVCLSRGCVMLCYVMLPHFMCKI